jgi:hypothetical protein
MSYIGQGLPADAFQGFTTDTFTGDGSATTFTLSKEPFSEDSLIVVIDNVIQQPTTNFTVSGTTLTIVGTAILSGIKGYAIHTGGPLPIGEANKLDLNGASDQLILDADADTTISADTDDQIDIKVGGTDVVKITAATLDVTGPGNTGGVININNTDTEGANTDNIGRINFVGNDASSSADGIRAAIETEVVSNFGATQINFFTAGSGASANATHVFDANGHVVLKQFLDATTAGGRVTGASNRGDVARVNLYQTAGSSDGGHIRLEAANSSNTMTEILKLSPDNVITAQLTSGATTDTTAGLQIDKEDESASSSTRMIGFIVGGQGRGFITNGTSDSGAPSLSAGSDRRLKKNITAYTGGYDKIKSIPVQTWDEQFTDATGLKGWIADELEKIFPEAVQGEANATKTVTNAIISKHGNCLRENITEEEFNELQAKEKYKDCTWSASKAVPAFQMSSPLQFFPDVVQALQAAITKIETLETKVKALEDA